MEGCTQYGRLTCKDIFRPCEHVQTPQCNQSIKVNENFILEVEGSESEGEDSGALEDPVIKDAIEDMLQRSEDDTTDNDATDGAEMMREMMLSNNLRLLPHFLHHQWHHCEQYLLHS